MDTTYTVKISKIPLLLLALYSFIFAAEAHASPKYAPHPQISETAPRCYVVADRLNSDSGADTLVALNLATGQSTVIGETGTFDIEAIAFAPDAQTLYATNGLTLGTLNLHNGMFEPIGALGEGNGSAGRVRFNDVDSLTVDSSTNTLFGVQRRPNGAPDLLFKIDPASGAAMPNGFGTGVDYREISITAAGEDEVDDIAADPFTGVLYAVANRGGTDGTLITIDSRSGTISEIGPLNVDDIEGIGFFSSGSAATLYGSTGDNGPLRAANSALYLLDKRNGNTTPVRAFPQSPTLRDYEAIDCLSMPAGIGDYVWNDRNANGKQDESEQPFPNITVNLWLDENSNNEPDAEIDTKIITTTTNADGLYEFTSLDPALVYFVEVERPPSYDFSPIFVGDVPDTEDSNFDGTTGFSPAITLAVGQFDATIDAGLTAPPLLVTDMTANVEAVRPGERIVFTITYTNLGNGNATNVLIQDAVPQFTQFVPQASANGWTCEFNQSSAGTICAYAIDQLPPQSGNTAGITFTVQVDSIVPADVTEIDNIAIISDDGENGSAPTGGPPPPLSIALLQPSSPPTTQTAETFLPLISRRAIKDGYVVIEITVSERNLNLFCGLLEPSGLLVGLCHGK